MKIAQRFLPTLFLVAIPYFFPFLTLSFHNLTRKAFVCLPCSQCDISAVIISVFRMTSYDICILPLFVKEVLGVPGGVLE